MPLDPRIVELLRREFVTIRTIRDPILKHALAQIKADLGMRGMSSGTPLVQGVDRRLAEEYRERSRDYLSRTLSRLSDLREPWTEALRIETEALLSQELQNDWGALLDLRKGELGPQLRDHATGQISQAQTTAQRLFEEELTFLVLREERRRLPLASLLASPRYQPVTRHWEAANRVFAQSPPQSTEVAREAVFALEALARLAVGDPAATLGDALKTLRGRTDDAGRHLLASVEKIWAFSNTAPSTRHGGGAGDEVTIPEAQFVLGVVQEALRLLLTFDLGA